MSVLNVSKFKTCASQIIFINIAVIWERKRFTITIIFIIP